MNYVKSLLFTSDHTRPSKIYIFKKIDINLNIGDQKVLDPQLLIAKFVYVYQLLRKDESGINCYTKKMDLARLNLALVDVDLAVGSGEAGAVAKARERVGPVHARAVVQARLRLEQMTSKEIKYLNNNLLTR